MDFTTWRSADRPSLRRGFPTELCSPRLAVAVVVFGMIPRSERHRRGGAPTACTSRGRTQRLAGDSHPTAPLSEAMESAAGPSALREMWTCGPLLRQPTPRFGCSSIRGIHFRTPPRRPRSWIRSPADGTTVLESDDDDGTGTGGDATNESSLASAIAGRTLASGGVYYIRVGAFSESALVNPYRLLVVVTRSGAAEVEPNDTAQEPTRSKRLLTFVRDR